jgi:ferric-dicitrate binding protein FerR (iron transport regulator)
MEDIYIALAKHFSAIANPEEEKRIADFRKNNLTEYEMLHRLWGKGEIEIYDFNPEDAWKKVRSKTNRVPAKTITLFTNLRKIAAVAAIFITGFLAVYYLALQPGKPETLLAENKTDSAARVELADGSIVWLNKNANLSYPDGFTGESREVRLSGTAFFDVAPDHDHPFIIHTYNSKITVLGTSFNVNTNDRSTEVTVKTGIVEVFSTIGNKKEMISKNQTAVVKDDLLISFETSNPNYLSWQNGVFIFSNTPINQVVRDLNSYYHNQLEMDTTQYHDCTLTARFNKAKLQEIVEILQTTCSLTIKKGNNGYQID